MANLEEKLGEKLFRRTTREVSLTVFGESLLKKSEAFWQSLLSFEVELGNTMIEPTGTLRLLSSHFISSPLLYKKIEEFKKKYPKVILDLRFADGGAKTWKLDKKNIDLLFGFPQIAGVTEDWKYKAGTQ